ncbi:MAG: glycosyltransferase [Candidatus Helarchaeota archaeon]|nr:glycosyltransferase [Candidatus Helarchaeota archaeon]
MMEPASIAVCIVFFNKAEQTAETIDCFSTSGLPIYVLNNGSAESATVAIKRHCLLHPNVKYLENPQNAGCGGGRNILAKQAKEDWLFFVDNDITIAGDYWMDNLRKHIRYSRDVDVFVPRILNVWDGTLVRHVRLSVQDGTACFLDTNSDFTNVFPGGGSVLARRLFERLGYYDEELKAFEDFELALRAIVNGQELCVKHLHDIELMHDHRVVSTPEDHEAVRVRYDVDRVRKAHDKVERVYGVSFDKNYAEWLANQIKDMTKPRKGLHFTKAVFSQFKKVHGIVKAVFKKLASYLKCALLS